MLGQLLGGSLVECLKMTMTQHLKQGSLKNTFGYFIAQKLELSIKQAGFLSLWKMHGVDVTPYVLPRGIKNVDDEKSGSLSPYPESLMLFLFSNRAWKTSYFIAQDKYNRRGQQ